MHSAADGKDKINYPKIQNISVNYAWKGLMIQKSCKGIESLSIKHLQIDNHILNI